MLTLPLTGIKINKHKFNLVFDLALAIIFVVEMELRFTGLRNHELLGLVLGVAIIVHLILHWSWIVSLTTRFFQKVIHESRLNYVLNVLLFVDMLIATVSGIVISRTLGLQLGINTRAFPWERIHIITSELSLLIIALHVAMHWKWIATYTGKLLSGIALPSLQRSQPPAPSVAIDQSGK